jgi:hypothetical protein
MTTMKIWNLIIYIIMLQVGRGKCTWTCDSPYAEQSGVQIPVGMWYFVVIWTSPQAHPASFTQGTGTFLGVKQPGHDIDQPTPPSTSTSILHLHRMTQVKLYCVMLSAILKWSTQKLAKCNFTLTVELIRITCSKFMFDILGTPLKIEA